MPDKLQPFEVGGVVYDKATLTEHRETMIQLRDTFLDAGQMRWSVDLSHNIGILAHVIEEMEV